MTRHPHDWLITKIWYHKTILRSHKKRQSFNVTVLVGGSQKPFFLNAYFFIAKFKVKVSDNPTMNFKSILQKCTKQILIKNKYMNK